MTKELSIKELNSKIDKLSNDVLSANEIVAHSIYNSISLLNIELNKLSNVNTGHDLSKEPLVDDSLNFLKY